MKILICGPAWVGDMVMAQSLFKKIRQRFPEAEISVLAPGWSLPLLHRMPEVNRTFELPIDHGQMRPGKRLQIGRKLATEKYDWAIIPQRSWKAALVPFFASIPVRTGYRGQFRYPLINHPRKLDKSVLTQTVQRQVALGLDAASKQPPVFEFPKLQPDLANRNRNVESLGLDLKRPVITFFPGAEYGPAKQWPLPYFRELAKKLTETGYQVWIMGGPSDKESGLFFESANIGHVHNLIGKTKLEDAIDLIGLSRISVTNDSGLMHVAAALGVHVEVLYGSSTPDYTPPLTNRRTIHYLGIDCSPCFQRVCPLGHRNCLHKILPSDIFHSIQKNI